MTALSISRRLVIWLTLSTVLFWAAGAGLAALAMQDEFSEIFDSAMQETASRLLPLALDDIRKGDVQDVAPQLDIDGNRDGYLTYQVRDKTGRVLMHSYDKPPATFEAPLVDGFWDGEGMRILTIAAPDGDVFVQVADSLAHRSEAITDGMLALSIPFVILVPISVIVLIFVIRKAMMPLAALKAEIVEKDSGNLTALSTEGLPSELEPIAASVNIVLTRLSSALTAEREFAANSAHELRTPIAGALAQTQLLVAELASSRGHERAALIEQSLRRLTGLVEKLLQLARADAGIGMAAELHDLGPVIEMVVKDMQRQAMAGRSITLTRSGGALVRPVNPDALAIALRNLIENALVHGTGGPVTVRVEDDAIVVSNSAKAFDDEELAHMRQRFHRAEDGSPGSGLGLSIVDRLLAQMNASLTLRSADDHGQAIFEAAIRFS